MELLKRFKKNIQDHHLFQLKDKLLLAVSGGLDSVVLVELCRRAGYDFEIAHCNFRLREEESERDEEFVKELGARYSIPVTVKKFDTAGYAKDKKISIQVAARELRYRWFHELLSLSTPGYGYLLTAHHLGDNIETMLMNFFKGTGIAGLRGILPVQGKIVRPLLFAKKEELLLYANEQGLEWREDSSNESDKYSRNYFRHHLIPVIQKMYPAVEDNLSDNLQRFREIEILYQQSIDLYKKKLLEPRGNEFHIPVLKLKKSEPLHSILFGIIKDFGFHANQVNEVIGLLDSPTGKYMVSASHRIIKHRNWLIIAPLAAAESGTVLVEGIADPVRFAAGNLRLELVPGKEARLPASVSEAGLDAGEIKFPLILRPWKTGDYFYPLGMKKKKKLSRFFIDQKLSRPDKEKVWVLEMDRKIIWVIGHRIDDRFRITPATKQMLKISFTQT